jgi:hypothetical protein
MFRKQGAEALRTTIQTAAESDEALEATVKALKNGAVTTEAFRNIRNDVINEMGDKIDIPALGNYMKRQLINAAEFTNLANRIAKRTGRSVDEVIKEAQK